MTPPFFIVGFQRSGTTLLRLMLDHHPALAVPLDTTGLWARYEERLAEYGNLATETDARRLVTDLLGEERIQLWETPLTLESVLDARTLPGYPGIVDAFHRAYAAHRGKARWGDKDPGNMERIDRLHRWFPDCQVIHIVRDGRDACLSQQEQDFGIQDLFECATAWREQVEWVRRIGAVLGPARYFELRYEDLIVDAEPVLRRLCAFLGASYEPAMLEYHTSVRQSVPDSKRHLWPKLDRPPQKDNGERWKREFSPGERIGFEKRAGRMLRAMGYETLARPVGAYGTEVAKLVSRVWRVVRRRLG